MIQKFEKVSRFADDEELKLPERKTQLSAGYDFMVAEDTIIYPAEELLLDLVS
jgi:dUTPase